MFNGVAGHLRPHNCTALRPLLFLLLPALVVPVPLRPAPWHLQHAALLSNWTDGAEQEREFISSSSLEQVSAQLSNRSAHAAVPVRRSAAAATMTNITDPVSLLREKGPESLTPPVKTPAGAPIRAIPECHYIFGLSKFTWAVLCDVLALVLVILCVPLLLTCSRRRPPGAPLFDCSWSCCGVSGDDEEAKPPWAQ
eukprot:TRINITY_DN38159_c0_g1_i1.p1 TRINITY_DN38159_c0_g1~~TRINITY_DN38159_c0_g1_i1.p1  ORF type:complete len:196 (-),score=30.78 TRINITY_DN38159_c0_g1_i1:91-678(-)